MITNYGHAIQLQSLRNRVAELERLLAESEQECQSLSSVNRKLDASLADLERQLAELRAQPKWHTAGVRHVLKNGNASTTFEELPAGSYTLYAVPFGAQPTAQQVESARDAERYRAMKEHDLTDLYEQYMVGKLNGYEWADLDKEIDAALQAGKEPKE